MGNDAPALHIRWMVRGDLDQIQVIEDSSYEFPWQEEDFLEMLRQRNVIGLVANQGDEVVGYVLYELAKGVIYVHNLTVAPSQRRMGFGTHLVDRLKEKLKKERSGIEVHVREGGLVSHLFLKKSEFQAVEVCKDWYSDQIAKKPPKLEDAYKFVYRASVDSQKDSAA